MFSKGSDLENKNLTKELNLWLVLPPFLLSFIIILAILIILRFLPERLPLFYSLAWGDGQLATHQQFLIIPASISAIALLNLVISWQLHHQQSFLKKVLLLSSIVVSLIFIITFIKIILMFI